MLKYKCTGEMLFLTNIYSQRNSTTKVKANNKEKYSSNTMWFTLFLVTDKPW